MGKACLESSRTLGAGEQRDRELSKLDRRIRGLASDLPVGIWVPLGILCCGMGRMTFVFEEGEDGRIVYGAVD